jgi:hypothetical protein
MPYSTPENRVNSRRFSELGIGGPAPGDTAVVDFCACDLSDFLGRPRTSVPVRNRWPMGCLSSGHGGPLNGAPEPGPVWMALHSKAARARHCGHAVFDKKARRHRLGSRF